MQQLPDSPPPPTGVLTGQHGSNGGVDTSDSAATGSDVVLSPSPATGIRASASAIITPVSGSSSTRATDSTTTVTPSGSATTTKSPLDGIAERVHEAVDLLLTSARHHDEWRASMATIGSSAHSIAESALALRRLVARSGDSNSSVATAAATATSARRESPKPHHPSHNPQYKCMYDTVLVRLPSSASASSAAKPSVDTDSPAVMYPTLIEPLTESLRSAQHDLAPGDINTLEHRGTMLLLPAMVPPAASAAYRRRILLDIGAREFESSVAWFLHAYPGPAFDDIYAFEMLPHTFSVPAAPALRHRFGDRARPFETNRFHFQRAVVSTLDVAAPTDEDKPLKPLSDEEIATIYGSKSFNPHYLRDRPECAIIDIARFITETIRPQLDDLFVIKMDIEGSEFAVVQHLRDRALLPLIDEFFIEVHFAHASMSVHGWDGFRTTRDEARALLADLRRDGVYAHSWP